MFDERLKVEQTKSKENDEKYKEEQFRSKKKEEELQQEREKQIQIKNIVNI